MMSASATAARARLRQVVHRLTVAERAALAVAAILGVAAVAAIHADAAGREWPDVATALIAAGLGAALLAAGIGWALVSSATALARRIDVAATLGSQALDELRTLRASLDAMQWRREADGVAGADARRIDDILRAVIAEMGRMRMAERDRMAAMVTISKAIVRATAHQEQARELTAEMERLIDEAFMTGYAVRDAEQRGKVVRL